jgi:hypothetical protein
MVTRQQLLEILNELVSTGEKITSIKVAEKANVSHSLIYKNFPDVAYKIKEAKSKAKLEKAKNDDKESIRRLRKENERLKIRLSMVKNNANEEKIAQLTSHIQELYAMYDSILDERNSFARELSKKG